MNYPCEALRGAPGTLCVFNKVLAVSTIGNFCVRLQEILWR